MQNQYQLCDLILDGLLGTGVTGMVRTGMVDMVIQENELSHEDYTTLYSADLPKWIKKLMSDFEHS